MAETAVSFVFPKFLEAVKMLRDLPKEVEELTDELESFQDFIHDANKMAEAEEDNNRRDRMRKRLMRLRKTAFFMEDVIDDYVICDEKQPEEDSRCAALLCEAVEFIKTQILRLQIAYRIEKVKSLAHTEKDWFENHFPIGSRSDGSIWDNIRMEPHFIKEDEVVGLEGPIKTLKKWLTEGRKERTVISIVGMAGSGKTTLSKQVFDKVHKHFECHVLITVSRSYDIEKLLRDLTNKICEERKEDPPRVESMDRMKLIEEVNKLLCKKRYIVLFDDVWNETFWDDIKFALIDNKNGSRILITTRVGKVVDFCKNSSFVEVYKLQPLSKEKSLELLCKKAFGYGFDGCCPKDYEEVGLDIVRKCECLPLAIVAIGSLLYRKCKSPPEWRRFSQNLSSELQSNSELQSVTKILSLSYDDLPKNLKSCLLYFGMYPEDYEVKCGRLIQQWIAEGFVKQDCRRNLEEVAQEQLMELISRSLVLVASFTTDGKVKACRVHDSIHEMIREKMKNTGFCHYIDEHNDFESSDIIRRLTIATSSKCLSECREESHVRSIIFFTKEDLSEDFTSALLAKYTRLKVLDFEFTRLWDVPKNLGSLIHLKYLSFRKTSISSLPKSIGELQNLETLDVRTGEEIEIPKEITKLRKLRCLFGYRISTIEVKDSLGKLTSLEKIHELVIDEDGVVIRELGKLNQLRDLRLSNFLGRHSDSLSSSINEMQLLERLDIFVQYMTEPIDLHITSSLSKLRKLHLVGTLKAFPSWILQLQSLVKLYLKYSMLNNIPLKSLGNIPNLLILTFASRSYKGETLHFENGGFGKLKELQFKALYKLRSIVIDSGALQSLEKLHMFRIPKLKTVPSGIQYLQKLQVLDVLYMPTEFQQRIYPETGEDHWMIKHVPDVLRMLNFNDQLLLDLVVKIGEEREILRAIEWMERASRKSASQVVGGG
ncbi:disease resistance protein RPM1-like [Vigna unguiculata]|uniref:disease resistance protein RPM1-like n=1 Tax=Vigna unguiculata TaxID=3917 RepID=UPI0010164C36|nr:disease resistance protein RPM1-like [Vigna unguiculata]